MFSLLSDTVSRKFKKYLRDIGLNKNRLHDARHTFLTYIANDPETPIKTACEIAGHSSIAITEGYIKAKDDVKENAMKRIDYSKKQS